MIIVDSANLDQIILRAERSRNDELYKVIKINNDASEMTTTTNDFIMINTKSMKMSNLNLNRAYHQELKIQNSKNQYILGHNGFEHLDVNKLRQLHEVIILNQAIQVKHNNEIICDTCIIAKSKKKSQSGIGKHHHQNFEFNIYRCMQTIIKNLRKLSIFFTNH